MKSLQINFKLKENFLSKRIRKRKLSFNNSKNRTVFINSSKEFITNVHNFIMRKLLLGIKGRFQNIMNFTTVFYAQAHIDFQTHINFGKAKLKSQLQHFKVFSQNVSRHYQGNSINHLTEVKVAMHITKRKRKCCNNKKKHQYLANHVDLTFAAYFGHIIKTGFIVLLNQNFIFLTNIKSVSQLHRLDVKVVFLF